MMNPAHLHLLLNHVPILGTLFGIIVMSTGIILKNRSIIKLALAVFIVCSLIAIPVFLTGEPAEELVENLPGISKDAIEKHEDMASIAVWLAGGLGILSLLAWTQMRKPSLSGILKIAVLIFAVGVFGFMVKIGDTGGKIRHTELQKQK